MSTPTPASILVVEDEPKLARLLVDYLAAAGHVPTWIADGREAMDTLRGRRFDVVLLDLALPGMDGLQICQGLREFSDAPVMMITARVEEVDRLIGLEAGADDYVCKPFSPREVVARVKAMLRRVQRAAAPPSALQVDAARFSARFHGQPLDLTRVEFRLLEALAGAPGRVFSRDVLLDRLYDDGRAVTDRTVDSHVRNLRRKLEAIAPGEEAIRSIYGLGYRWDG